MTESNNDSQAQKPASSIVVGIAGAAVGALLTFLVMYFGVVAESRELAAKAVQESAAKSAQITAHVQWRDGMLEEKALYELNNTQNLALVAKLRGFCGKPCEGVE